jgi:DNA helicase II / ATP-dependent DNA helicase PcrA
MIAFVNFVGLKFLDTAYVKDLRVLLRFVESPRDRVVGFRVIQLVPGVGPSSAQRVLDLMEDRPDLLGMLTDPGSRSLGTQGRSQP